MNAAQTVAVGALASMPAIVTLPFWWSSVAPRFLRYFGKVHPAADLCIRLLDMNLGWSGSGKYDDMRHETGARIGISYDQRATVLFLDGNSVRLNVASRAALTIAVRRWKKAQARHDEARTDVAADRALSQFAQRVATTYDPDKVVPITRERRA